MKKWFGISLTLITCLSLLAGCGGGKNKADAKSEKADGVSIWTPFTLPSDTVSSWQESPFHKGLEKLSGIHVDWNFPSEGTDSAQAFNLMMSEDKLPDIICYGLRDDAESYIEDGTIHDLTKLLKKKAPHYWKYLQEHPEFDKAMKTDSGKYYGFGFFRETPQQAMFIGPMLRQDWLDENNLSTPQNIADWENVLKVFHDKYGASMAWVNDKMDPGFAGAFGAYATALPTFYLDTNNKVQFAQAQPEWKNYMEWLHKMYKAGYIDPDIVTMDDQSLETKVSNNKVGAASAYGSRITVFNDNSKTKGGTANWVATKYPDQADGSKSASIYYDGQVQFPTYVITKDCKGKDLDKALEWLDFAFTKEGSDYWNMGKEGDTWKMVDGQQVYTDKVLKNKLGATEARKLYTGNYGTGLGVQSAASNKLTESSTTSGEAWYNDNQKAVDRRLNLPITMTAKESKEAATITNTLNSYVNENTYDFITGDRPISEFDDFVKEMNDQGLNKLLKIKRASYQRYLER